MREQEARQWRTTSTTPYVVSTKPLAPDLMLESEFWVRRRPNQDHRRRRPDQVPRPHAG